MIWLHLPPTFWPWILRNGLPIGTSMACQSWTCSIGGCLSLEDQRLRKRTKTSSQGKDRKGKRILKSMESTSRELCWSCSTSHDIPSFFFFFRTCYSATKVATFGGIVFPVLSIYVGMVLSAIESNNDVSRIGKGQRRISLLYALLVYCSATRTYCCEYIHELTPVCSQPSQVAQDVLHSMLTWFWLMGSSSRIMWYLTLIIEWYMWINDVCR